MTTHDWNKIQRAMRDPDHFVLQMTYQDKSGALTERMVSPIRMEGGRTMLALCLCRENPRRFELDRCSDMSLVDANDVLMPVPIRSLEHVSSCELAVGLVGSH